MMNDFVSDLLSAFGLILTVLGAAVAARSAILTKETAVEIGVSRWTGETMEENLELPAVRNLLVASRTAQIGLWLVATGTALQLIPVVYRLVG